MRFFVVLGLEFHLVDEAEDDYDYSSDYDSSNEDADDIFEKIANY